MSSYEGSGPICALGGVSTVELRTLADGLCPLMAAGGAGASTGAGADSGGTVDSTEGAGASVVTVAREPQFVQGVLVETGVPKIGRYDCRL
jgi:hypothetical protein